MIDWLSTLSYAQLALYGFLLLRAIQRAYYFLKGHVQYWSFNPRAAMHEYFKKSNIAFSHHEFTTRDNVIIKYSKLGNGNKLVLLCNGVGTDLFMWLPLLREMQTLNPSLFNDITLIAPSYRGLFGSTKVPSTSTSSNVNQSNHSAAASEEVVVTMENCVADLPELLQAIKTAPAHKGQFKDVTGFDTTIGWSMGAQTAITALATHTQITSKLLLLNPSSGQTLHSVLQCFVPLPMTIGRHAAAGIRYLITQTLRPLIPTTVWPMLQAFAFSPLFRILLELGSFFGGSPPEQGAYFHCYMRDVFETRHQTRGLLDLIVALDSPVPAAGLRLKNKTMIISGLPDIMTGVYHSTRLASSMSDSTHVMFTMGSHFLLIEWPELVAVEVLGLILGAEGDIGAREARSGKKRR